MQLDELSQRAALHVARHLVQQLLEPRELGLRPLRIKQRSVITIAGLKKPRFFRKKFLGFGFLKVFFQFFKGFLGFNVRRLDTKL